MKKALLNIITLIITCANLLAHAGSPQEQGANFEAHVHGLSEMTIAIEGKSLEIQIISPAMNLVGFEHKARTKKDIAAVENAASVLSKHESLFSFIGDRCTLVNTSLDVSSVIDKHHDAHDHSAKPEMDENKHAQHDNHSEITVDYHYNCESLGKLSSISVALFEAFFGIHQLRVMWITETQQGATTLNAEHNTIILR